MRPAIPAGLDGVGGRVFSDVFARTSVPVRAYVRRHCDPGDCDDVVAEVYRVAWRRFADLPDDPLPWLLGTARRVLANHWRGRDRRDRLAAELRGMESVATEPDVAGQAISRVAILDALAALDAADRELLLLAGWDGLDTAGIAAVIGRSPGAARMRLSRARHRLQQLLTEAPAEPERLWRSHLVEEGN